MKYFLLFLLFSCVETPLPNNGAEIQLKALEPKYTIAIIGDGFNNSNKHIFYQTVDSVKKGLIVRPPLKQRQSQIFFDIQSYSNQLVCKKNNDYPSEFMYCDQTKVVKAVTGSPNAICVIAYGKDSGSGGAFVVIGSKQTLYKLSALTAHEFGHSKWGFPLDTGGVMGSIQTTAPYAFWQQDIINGILDNTAGVFIDHIPPTVSIQSPYNNQSFAYGSSWEVNAFAQGDPMRAHLYIDGVLAQGCCFASSNRVYWDGEYFANDVTGIKFHINLNAFPVPFTRGTHTIGVKVVDAVYNETISWVTVNIY